jgi:hypothetical protein
MNKEQSDFFEKNSYKIKQTKTLKNLTSELQKAYQLFSVEVNGSR